MRVGAEGEHAGGAGPIGKNDERTMNDLEIARASALENRFLCWSGTTKSAKCVFVAMCMHARPQVRIHTYVLFRFRFAVLFGEQKYEKQTEV